MFAARRLGRRGGVVNIFQQLVEQRAVQIALGRDGAIAIELFPAFGEDVDQLVDHHIAGACVERNDLILGGFTRQYRDVGDAADVQSYARFGGAAEEHVVDEGHERRAMASGCDIAGAEIRDDRDTKLFGDDGSFADLKRVGGVAASLVVDRLAVGADQVDGFLRDLVAGANLSDGFRVEFAEFEVEARDVGDVTVGVRDGEDVGAGCGRIGNAGVGDGFYGFAVRCR